jgi:uncharacterized protein YjbI with pentapeptide repeats
MADKVYPFDIKALGDAVNDSAARVSTIWITFLIFSLYLLVAVGTVTQRQLFLDEPTKLPVLNIDLPLWWFFLLAPILFVILHSYVLLQVLLLGRTAAAYNAAIAHYGFTPEASSPLRQRLANTLFAQIFAGSPREREGAIGWLLKGMAWITLAIAPILIVLAFQFRFLPYHSHIVTWMHRLLILIELGAFFLIWPLALDAQRDFRWPEVRASLGRLAAIPRQMFGSRDDRRDASLWLREQSAALSACILFFLVPLSLATFPGEPHVNIFTGQSPSSVHCDRWFTRQFDRFFLPLVDVVDDEKLAKIVRATSERNLPSYLGKRTLAFRDRDLNCSNLSLADLRNVDLVGAQLYQANLGGTALDGAALDDAQLQGARLDQAELKGASLNRATLQKASLEDAHLQGASFSRARLEGASLDGAQLQGAILDSAQLQGATLIGAQLQGASLFSTQLQGATLDGARLQGASLTFTQFQGASLKHAQLQGVQIFESNSDHSILSNVWTWRAGTTDCTRARVTDAKSDNVVNVNYKFNEAPEQIVATSDAIKNFIENSIAGIPDASARKKTAAQMQRTLTIRSDEEDDSASIAKVWTACAEASTKTSRPTFDKELVALLRYLACHASENHGATASGIVRNWIVGGRKFIRLETFTQSDEPSEAVSNQLARGLLGWDGERCLARDDFDEAMIETLRTAAKNTASKPVEILPSGPQGFLPPESPDAARAGTMPSGPPAAQPATPPR